MVMFDVYKLGLQLYKEMCTNRFNCYINCNFKWVTIKLIILCVKSVTKRTQWVSCSPKLSVVDIKKLANGVHSLQKGADTVIPKSGKCSL